MRLILAAFSCALIIGAVILATAFSFEHHYMPWPYIYAALFAGSACYATWRLMKDAIDFELADLRSTLSKD